eukprot:Skav211084  [mRNA]  locus=scaffold2002:133662:134778:- [translate_table: standard]
MAIRWLQQSPWSVVPTDKDGGYCLVNKKHLSVAHQEILAKPWYAPYPTNLFPGFRTLAKKYSKLSRQVADLEASSGMARAMRQSLKGGERHLVRKLNVTVKSHKPAGQVAFRNIHGGMCYPFSGLGAWLAHNLQSLRKIPHILRNSGDLVTQLEQFQSGNAVTFVKVDIKDCFMSGTREELQQFASELLGARIRNVGKQVIDFLLKHQYVQSDFCPQQMWQVVVGTGMGLNFSGELSDAAFYTMAEKWAISDPDIFGLAGILGYWRFKDDILIIVRSDCLRSFRSWFEQWKRRAGSFALEVDTISQDETVFLDLDLQRRTKNCEDLAG